MFCNDARVFPAALWEGFFVFPGFDDGVVIAGLGLCLSGGRDVVEVVFFQAGGELDFIERVEVEVFLGSVLWALGAENATGEKEGFFVLKCVEEVDGVVG